MIKDIEKIKKKLSNSKINVEFEFKAIEAAVLVPLIDMDEGLSILFQVRSSNLNWQPGEVCFPGGKVEDSDIDFMTTAIRETCEELNLNKEDIDIYGQLNCFFSQLGVMAYPYLGKIDDIKKVKPNLDEVSEVFTVPLEFLLKVVPEEVEIELETHIISGNFPVELLEFYGGDYKKKRFYKLYFYRYKNYIIWGFTARILKGFLDYYKSNMIS